MVDAQVGGKIAQVGARLIDATAKTMAEQFFKKFAALVEKPEPVVETVAAAAMPADEELNFLARIWRSIVRLFSGPSKV